MCAEDTDIPEMVPELSMLDKLKVRVQLARKIDQAQHKIKNENHDRNWMKEAAEAMELELDSDLNRYAAPLHPPGIMPLLISIAAILTTMARLNKSAKAKPLKRRD